MLNILKMFIEKEVPIGLSSLGLYKTKNTEIARKMRNISGLAPIFCFESNSFNFAVKDNVR